MRRIARMTEPQVIVLGKIRIELRDGQLRITPNKPHPGSPVIVDEKRLERWASRLYRDGVFQ